MILSGVHVVETSSEINLAGSPSKTWNIVLSVEMVFGGQVLPGDASELLTAGVGIRHPEDYGI